MPATTLVATVLPELAAVRLEVANVPDGPAPITRLDRNGARPVRQLPGQEASAGLLAVVDYEPALSGTVRYEIDGIDALGDPATVSTTVDLGGAARPVVTVPLRPAIRAALEDTADLIDIDEQVRSGSIRHQILGASTAVVILRPMSARSGQLIFRTDTYESAAAVRDVLRTPDVVLVRQAAFAGLDLYATVESVRIAPVLDDAQDAPAWTVTAAYAEEAPPTGGLLSGAAWTVEDLAALVDTVDAVLALFPTVYDLAVGPR